MQKITKVLWARKKRENSAWLPWEWHNICNLATDWAATSTSAFCLKRPQICIPFCKVTKQASTSMWNLSVLPQPPMLPGALRLLHLPEDKEWGIEGFLKAEKSLRLRLCPIQMPYLMGLISTSHWTQIFSYNLVSVMRAIIYYGKVYHGKSKKIYFM